MPSDRAESSHAVAANLGARDRALLRMAEIVGSAHAIADRDRQSPFLHELRGLYTGNAALVLRPGSTREVAQILAIAHEAGIGVVPQGGNLSLIHI